MKYVLLTDTNQAQEIIPEYIDVFPGIPAHRRYAPDFLQKCVQVDDDTEVESGWYYDPVSRAFSSEPPELTPETEPDLSALEARVDDIGEALGLLLEGLS